MPREFQVENDPLRILDLSIPGWSSIRDLLLLATVAQMLPDHSVMIEAGSYLGRSSYAIGKNMNPSCTLHCIDVWDTDLAYFSPASQLSSFANGRTKGSPRKMDRAARLAKDTGSWQPGWEQFTKDCDNIMSFAMNIHDYVVPNDMSAVFIDADHSFDSVMSDIRKFNVDVESLLLGDDFSYYWPDVARAVGMIKEETKRTLISVPESTTWFLWPMEGYWADKLPEFLQRAERDRQYLISTHK